MYDADVFIWIALFAGIAFVAYLFLTSRHRERMAMIEKGFDASLLQPTRSNTRKYSSLKWGIAAIGVSLGLICGYFLETTTQMDEGAAYFSMIFLFGGLGLVLYYMVVRRHDEL